MVVKKTDDMYSAIDVVADTIEGQVRKGKDKFAPQKACKYRQRPHLTGGSFSRGNNRRRRGDANYQGGSRFMPNPWIWMKR